MTNDERLQAYIRQRRLQAPLLEGASERCQPSYWWAARKLTRRQHRRWWKNHHWNHPKYAKLDVPF